MSSLHGIKVGDRVLVHNRARDLYFVETVSGVTDSMLSIRTSLFGKTVSARFFLHNGHDFVYGNEMTVRRYDDDAERILLREEVISMLRNDSYTKEILERIITLLHEDSPR